MKTSATDFNLTIFEIVSINVAQLVAMIVIVSRIMIVSMIVIMKTVAALCLRINHRTIAR